MTHDLQILKSAPHPFADAWEQIRISEACRNSYTPPTIPPPEPRPMTWRTREEKMALLDPCPELTLASKRLQQSEELYRAALHLFGGCAVCLILSTLIALFVII